MEEILGNNLKDNEYKEIKINYYNKNLLYGIYFSASWCRPC